MASAAELARSASGVSREVAEDIQQLFGDLANNEVPLADDVQLVFSVVFFIIYTERESLASTFPSYFTGAQAYAFPKDFRGEDDDQTGELQLEVTAASLGFDKQDHILKGIELARTLPQRFGDFDFSTTPELDRILNELLPKFEERIESTDLEGLEIPGEAVTMRVTEAGLFHARVVAGDAVEVVEEVRFEAKETGSATISARTADGRFGGQQIADQIDISVPTIQLDLTPDEVWIRPDDVQSFVLTVSNALHPDSVQLVEATRPLQGAAEITLGGGGTHDILYVAPAEPDYSQPDLLAVEHTGLGGARASGEPPRRTIATIRFATICLTTAPTCLEPGDSLQIETDVPESDPAPTIVWTASAGSISSTGLFQAPDMPASVTIRASLEEQPMAADSIVVQVGGCSCSVSASVGAITATPTSGYFTLTADQSSVIGFGWDGVDQAGNLGFGGTVEDPVTIPVGILDVVETGEVFETIDGLVFSNNAEQTELDRLTITISENEAGNILAGNVQGPVITGTGETVTFTMEFRVEADPEWSDEIQRVCRMD